MMIDGLKWWQGGISVIELFLDSRGWDLWRPVDDVCAIWLAQDDDVDLPSILVLDLKVIFSLYLYFIMNWIKFNHSAECCSRGTFSHHKLVFDSFMVIPVAGAGRGGRVHRL